MGDRLGIPGAVSFAFSFTGQLTHFSKLQHSCVLLYPLICCCFFLPFDFLCDFFLLRCDKRQLSLFVLHFLLQGAIDRLFLSTTWEMYPLRFQVSNFKNSTTKQILKFNSFSDVGELVKITCKWTNQIFSFFPRTLLVLGNRTRDSSAQKKFNEITIKGKSKYFYLFIYLVFIYLLFIYLLFF